MPRRQDTLSAVVDLVTAPLDLERMLRGIVDLVTEATGCHACFVYTIENERLLLRAASPVFAGQVGRLSFGLDEGITGWVARERRPELVRERLLDDPRVRYVPELQEERFQSMAAVPLLARSGESIGVIVVHSEAPLELDADVLSFVTHTASLVAGAIENAQLFLEARRRVDSLTALAALSRRLAAGTTRDELYRAATGGGRRLVGADLCQVFRLSPASDALELAASEPVAPATAQAPGESMRLLLGLLRPGALAGEPAEVAGPTGALWPGYVGGEVLVAPLAAADEQLGLVCAVARRRGSFSAEHGQLLRSVADQTAVALQKAELIERLTAANVVKDLLEALAEGSLAAARAKADEAGIDLHRPHAVVQFEGASDAARFEAALRRRFPTVLVDVRPGNLRTIVSLGDEPLDALRRECGQLAEANGVCAGLSGLLSGEEDSRRGLREAADAARVAAALEPAGGVVTYDELGAYKYLVRLGADDAPHDRHREALDRVLEYDARRRTSLAATLEEFVAQRGNVAAAARALYIHPNTLRQRLERIEQVAGLDAQHEDLLAHELALKVVRLQRAGEGW